jgi:ABC-type Fe3+-hydroxamate transport system substrate-binding protein
MIESRDQLGREINLSAFPRRIISLVPSISELLWDLGLKDELIGITKFCIHPDEMFRTKTRIGGTKNIQHSIVNDLKPDLIIGNKEENTKEDIEELEKHFPVWMSDVNTFEDAIGLIKEIGTITDRKDSSEKIIKNIQDTDFSFVKKPRVIYLIWHEPCFAVGKNTFIDAMLEKSGFLNCITEPRYPEISGTKIQELNPDFLFLSTEPFPFRENHFEHYSRFLPKEKIKIVDGEMFSWYGSRMIKAFPYFKKLRSELNQ